MKWEPIEGEKHCAHCQQIKPLSAFSPKRMGNGDMGWHPYCKACRCLKARRVLLQGGRKDRPKSGRMGEASPGAWKWPADTRPLHDQQRDIDARNWRYPVEAGALTWRVA